MLMAMSSPKPGLLTITRPEVKKCYSSCPVQDHQHDQDAQPRLPPSASKSVSPDAASSSSPAPALMTMPAGCDGYARYQQSHNVINIKAPLKAPLLVITHY